MRFGLIVMAAAAGTSVLATPAVAQSTSSVDRNNIRRVLVYGTDPCPPSPPGEIVVCARRPDTDRYRIPERFREPDALTGPHEAWAQKAERLEMQGANGISSCTPVGPGGASGCMQQLIKQSIAEKRADNAEKRQEP